MQEMLHGFRFLTAAQASGFWDQARFEILVMHPNCSAGGLKYGLLCSGGKTGKRENLVCSEKNGSFREHDSTLLAHTSERRDLYSFL
jgi:hypothetical protein